MEEKFGLPQKTIEIINELFAKYTNLEKVIIFGSRADGTYKNSSDIDFAILGKDIDFRFIRHLSFELDELPTPYMYDVLDYNCIKNEKLRQNIDEFGKVFYKR